MVTATVLAYPRFDMARRRQAYNKVPTDPGTLGAFVREMREAMGLSQEEFAALVGDNMGPTDVSQLERGKVGLPKPPRMIAIARALSLPVVELYVAAGFPEFREQSGRLALDSDPEMLAALLAFRQLEPGRRRSYIRLIKEDLKGPPPDQLDEVDEQADESAASA